jgi:hypothetical protein
MTLPRGGRDREVRDLTEQKELKRGRCRKGRRGCSARGKRATAKLESARYVKEKLESAKLVRERLGRGR